MPCSIIINRNFNHQLYNMLSSDNIDEARKLMQSGVDYEKFTGKELKGFISLMLKYLFLIGDDKSIDEWYNNHLNILMKRDIKDYCKYFFIRNYEKSLKSFAFLIDNFKLEEDDVDFLIDNNMEMFLVLLDGYYLKTSKESNNDEYKFLKNYQFDKDIVSNILQKIYKTINNKDLVSFLNNLINYQKNKIVIDGGNILFSEKGDVNLSSYKLLLNSLKFFKEEGFIPILIIHNRHMKENSKLRNKGILDSLRSDFEEFIFETPYKQNDDLYILYAAFFCNCEIISNDKFRDHIFKFKNNLDEKESSLFKNFIEDSSVIYSFNKNNKILVSEKDLSYFSKCIQLIENQIHIPTVDGDLYSLEFEIN